MGIFWIMGNADAGADINLTAADVDRFANHRKKLLGERKTQGAAIIVYGFQGGMISGMAIGSLLVGYIGPAGVFAVGAVAITLTMIYAILAVPAIANTSPSEPASFGTSVKTLGRHVLLAGRNPQLLQAIALIGIPAKAVLTGIVVFAVPLLMAREGYRQEDIGQLLMIYAAGA